MVKLPDIFGKREGLPEPPNEETQALVQKLAELTQLNLSCLQDNHQCDVLLNLYVGNSLRGHGLNPAKVDEDGKLIGMLRGMQDCMGDLVAAYKRERN